MDLLKPVDEYSLYILGAGVGLAALSGLGLFGISEWAWTGWALAAIGVIAGLTRVKKEEYVLALVTMTTWAVLSITNAVTDIVGGWFGSIVSATWPLATAATAIVAGKALYEVYG